MRGIVLFSHHFIKSAWEKPVSSLSLQLKDRTAGRVFAWYWGHEHRCATYDPGTDGFHGACVGNGAFLEKWGLPRSEKVVPSWYPIERCQCLGSEPSDWWPHGFLELELAPSGITETFHLEVGEPHMRRLRTRPMVHRGRKKGRPSKAR